MENFARQRHPSPLRLGELLARRAAITQEDLALALAEQDLDAHGAPIGRLLVRLGVIDELMLTSALAEQSGLPLIDLELHVPSQSAIARLSREAAFRLQALPLDFRGSSLLVAVAEPVDRHRHRQVVQGTGRAVEFALVPAPALSAGLELWYPHPSATVASVAPGEVLDLHPTTSGPDETSASGSNATPKQPEPGGDRVLEWFAAEIASRRARTIRLVPVAAEVRIEFTTGDRRPTSLVIPRRAGSILMKRLVQSGATVVLPDVGLGSTPTAVATTGGAVTVNVVD